MANQITFKQGSDVKGKFLVSAFNKDGVPVLDGWQEFDVNSKMVWNPGKYEAPITTFYIGKGIGPDIDNNFVAYAVRIDFNKSTNDATVVLGISSVPCGNSSGSPCNIFTVKATGVDVKIIEDGKPVDKTQLPDRCLIAE